MVLEEKYDLKILNINFQISNLLTFTASCKSQRLLQYSWAMDEVYIHLFLTKDTCPPRSTMADL